MVQPPAGAQAPTVDKPKPSKQTVSKPGKPKSSTPVKAKPVKATQTAGQRSATQPAAVKPSKPPATASKQQQQKTAPSKSPQKLRDWPQVDPMDVDDMQPSTSGRPPAAAAAPTAPVAGGAAITTGRGFGRAAPAAEPDAEGAPQRLRLFAYAVESKRVMAALQECGLDHRFVFTPDLKQAQAIVSCKMTPGGKTQNIAQVSSWWLWVALSQVTHPFTKAPAKAVVSAALQQGAGYVACMYCTECIFPILGALQTLLRSSA
jgi:hypothetical protein